MAIHAFAPALRTYSNFCRLFFSTREENNVRKWGKQGRIQGGGGGAGALPPPLGGLKEGAFFCIIMAKIAKKNVLIS